MRESGDRGRFLVGEKARMLVQRQWAGLIALFLVLSGGVAYAANTVGSGDIINESILSQDIKNGQVKTADIGDGEVTTADAKDDNLTGRDIAPDSLRGADIDESTLSGGGGGGGGLGRAQVARDSTAAAMNTLGVGGLDPAADQVIQTTLPTGNWVVEANATFGANSSVERNISCGLFDANNPLTEGNTHTQAAAIFSATMSLTGVSDGGVVRLACATDPASAQVRDRILVATEVGNVTGP
jgi:hypothetical protein